jgi:hypothetical protein
VLDLFMAEYHQPDRYFLRKSRAWWDVHLAAIQKRRQRQQRDAQRLTLYGAQVHALAAAMAQGSQVAQSQWRILWDDLTREGGAPALLPDTAVVPLAAPGSPERQAQVAHIEAVLRQRREGPVAS